MSTSQRCLCVTSGRHRYVFRYRVGQESIVLACLVDSASRPESRLTWLAAAVLSYQMGRSMESELEPVA